MGVFQQEAVDLLAHRLLDVEGDLLFHLLLEGVAKFLLVFKAEIFQEYLVDLGQLKFLDVLDGDFDLHVFPAHLLVGVVIGGLGVERAGFAGLGAGELRVEIVDLQAADAARTRDHLPVVLMADDLAAEFQIDVGSQVIAALDAAVFDGNQRALLLAQVLHRLIDVLLGDGDLRLLHLEIGKVREGDLRRHFHREGIFQRAFIRQLDRFLGVELGIADDLKVVFGDSLVVAFAHEGAGDLVLHVFAESAFEKFSRGMADAEAGDGRLLAQFLILLVEFDEDPLIFSRGISTVTRLAAGPTTSTLIG